MIAWWAVQLAGATPCTSDLTRGELNERLQEADLALARRELQRTGELADALIERLPCARFTVRPADLAPAFRARGWTLAAEADERADVWLAAAYGLQPRHLFDPPLKALRLEAWERGTSTWQTSPTKTLVPPASGELLLNGAADLTYRDGLPWLLQHVDASGSVIGTWLVHPGSPVPPYPALGMEPLDEAPAAPSARRHSRRTTVAGLGIVLLGGAALAGSQVVQREHANQDATPATILASRSKRAVPYTLLATGGWALVGAGAVVMTIDIAKGEW